MRLCWAQVYASQHVRPSEPQTTQKSMILHRWYMSRLNDRSELERAMAAIPRKYWLCRPILANRANPCSDWADADRTRSFEIMLESKCGFSSGLPVT